MKASVCILCNWLSHRLGCVEPRAIEIEEITRIRNRTENARARVGEAGESVTRAVLALEEATIDLNLQKHALEALAEDMTK